MQLYVLIYKLLIRNVISYLYSLGLLLYIWSKIYLKKLIAHNCKYI